MNIPSIPTDNLYKFIALTGVAISLSSILFFSSKLNEIYNNIDSYESEIKILELENEFLNEDLEKLESKVAVLRKSFPDNFLIKDSDSLSFQLFSSQKDRLTDNKNLREYYEFLFKYEDKIIPQKVIIQEIKIENERIFEVNRDIKRKATQIQLKVNMSKSMSKRLFSLSILLVILIFVGWKMARYGFKQWREIVQKPYDEKLSIELEILKKSNTNIS